VLPAFSSVYPYDHYNRVLLFPFIWKQSWLILLAHS